MKPEMLANSGYKGYVTGFFLSPLGMRPRPCQLGKIRVFFVKFWRKNLYRLDNPSNLYNIDLAFREFRNQILPILSQHTQQNGVYKYSLSKSNPVWAQNIGESGY